MDYDDDPCACGVAHTTAEHGYDPDTQPLAPMCEHCGVDTTGEFKIFDAANVTIACADCHGAYWADRRGVTA